MCLRAWTLKWKIAVTWCLLLGMLWAAPEAARGAAPDSPRLSQDLADGYFRQYAVGHPGSGPAIVAVDEDDTVWVAVARTGQLGRFANGHLTLFDIGPESRPVGVVSGGQDLGHQGYLWIAASFDNKILRFDKRDGSIREYPIEGETSWPFNIALHPSGDVWFTQRASGRLGRLDPETGAVEHFDPPTPSSGPAGLAVDHRTGAIWFTESYADRVARFDPATREFREYVMGDASSGLQSGPAGLAVDAQGGVWFAKLEGILGHIAPGSDEVEIIQLPRAARRPAGVATAGDGSVWIAALDGNRLLHYLPGEHLVTQYPLPVGGEDEEPTQPPFSKTSRPFGIATDSQGNVWFSQQYVGQLAVLDVAAPTLEVLSPGGRPVTGAGMLVTYRAEERVSGLRSVRMFVDGRPVDSHQGVVDLSGFDPGEHELHIAVEDGAGHEARAVRKFRFEPDHLALLDLLERSAPEDEAGLKRFRRWRTLARRIPKDPRGQLTTLRSEMTADGAAWPGLPVPTLTRWIDDQLGRAARVAEVRILDQAPYFEPRSLRLETGDSVRFIYDPPIEGHNLSHRLHRVVIRGAEGEASSPLLRAGESFLHSFERTGDFAVGDPEAENGAAMSVEVR